MPSPPALYCQKCRAPVNADPSLDDLNPASFKLLTESTVPSSAPGTRSSQRRPRPAYPQSRRDDYQHALQDARNPTFRRSVPAALPQHGPSSGAARRPSRDSQAMSFVMLSESQIAQPPAAPLSANDAAGASAAPPETRVWAGKQSDEMETATRLFEMLSARSDIDHPVCVECTDLLVDGLQKRLAAATRERDAYVDYLRRANTEVPTDDEWQQAKAALETAKTREARAAWRARGARGRETRAGRVASGTRGRVDRPRQGRRRLLARAQRLLGQADRPPVDAGGDDDAPRPRHADTDAAHAPQRLQ